MTSSANVALSITAVNQSGGAFTGVRNQLQGLRTAVGGMTAGMSANRRIVQQAGMQMSDFTVQVAGGQSAILAMTQQLPQFLQMFGATGAVAAVLVTVFGSLALMLWNTGTSLSQISPLMGVLRQEFVLLLPILSAIGNFFINMANLVVNNLDRIIITVAVVVGWFAGKWVAAMVAARLATMSFAGTLLFLRTALIRTGIGAIIIGAGELVYQFMRLSEAAGGFGNAMVLVWGVVKGVFSRMGNVVYDFLYTWQAIWNEAKLAAVMSFAGIVLAVADAFNFIAGGAVGLVNGVIAAFSNMAPAIGEFFVEMANGVIGIFESLLNKVSEGLNSVLGSFRQFAGIPGLGALAAFTYALPEELPLANLGRIENQFAGAGQDMAAAFSGAFSAAMSQDYVDTGAFMNDVAAITDDISGEISALNAMALVERHFAGLPIPEIQALRDALNSLPADTMVDVRDWFGDIGEAASGGGGGGGGGAADAIREVASAFDELSNSISSSIETAFMDAVKGTKSVADAFKSMASSIIAELYRVVMVQSWVQKIMNWVNPLLQGGLEAIGSPILSSAANTGPNFTVPAPAPARPASARIGNENPVAVTLNISTGVAQTVRSEINSLMPAIRRDVQAGVEDARRRGGR